MQRIIDAGDNHEDEDAEEGLSSIEEILGSPKKAPKHTLIIEMDKMLGLVKTKIMKFPKFRVERTYTKINGDEYLHPLMKYPSLVDDGKQEHEHFT
jgi:hypothetical protein